jgi:hypothetical protein
VRVLCSAQARALWEEANRLRTQVEQLNWTAAERIEAELNAPVAPSATASPRLDLHGLHVAEALGALERRLAEMEAGVGVARAPRRLNVIVGRGRHSSGAEASIPRAVESFLTQRGNNFAPGRAGCLVVRVRHR